MGEKNEVLQRAEQALRQLRDEGLVTAVSVRWENNEARVVVGATDQMDPRAPDYDAARADAVKARIKEALDGLPLAVIRTAARGM